MSTLRIRPAHAHDRDLLAQWAQAMALETEHKHLDEATVRAGMEAGIADPAKARYFIAMQESAVAGRETIAAPAGTLMLTREWSDWRNGDWWWIQSVYVAPPFRRQGVFSALYRHVETLARQTPGVVGLRLYVERENTNAFKTYTALGMVDAGYAILEAEFAKRP
ncbi:MULTISPECIES: GNAT family N-acetyltransferase [unclassified Lysobacter]|uniref:GNAT family N-acetyltransferase n=1 Tax=unclassified Lysobacter TaxID=2635362 RepID=UPI0020B26885|nr:GNAT family N-acetyltransferase [Lysobacter sp. MMG2]